MGVFLTKRLTACTRSFHADIIQREVQQRENQQHLWNQKANKQLKKHFQHLLS